MLLPKLLCVQSAIVLVSAVSVAKVSDEMAFWAAMGNMAQNLSGVPAHSSSSSSSNSNSESSSNSLVEATFAPDNEDSHSSFGSEQFFTSVKSKADESTLMKRSSIGNSGPDSKTNSQLTSAAMDAMAQAEKASKAKVAAVQDAKQRRIRSEEAMEKAASAQAAAEIAIASKAEDEKAADLALSNYRSLIARSQSTLQEARAAEEAEEQAERVAKSLMNTLKGYQAKAEAAKQSAMQSLDAKKKHDNHMSKVNSDIQLSIKELEQSDSEVVEKAKAKQKAIDTTRSAKDTVAAASKSLKDMEQRMSGDMIEEAGMSDVNGTVVTAFRFKQEADTFAARNYADLMGDMRMVDTLSGLRQTAADKRTYYSNAKEQAAKELEDAQRLLKLNETVVGVWEGKLDKARTMMQAAATEESTAFDKATRLQKEAEEALARAARAKVELQAARNRTATSRALLNGYEAGYDKAKASQTVAQQLVQDRITRSKTATMVLQQSKEMLATLDVQKTQAENKTAVARREEHVALVKQADALKSFEDSKNSTMRTVLKRLKSRLAEASLKADTALAEQQKVDQMESDIRDQSSNARAKLQHLLEEKTSADKEQERLVSSNEKMTMQAVTARAELDSATARAQEAQNELNAKAKEKMETSKRLAMAKAAIEKAAEAREETQRVVDQKAVVAKTAQEKAMKAKQAADDTAAALARADRLLVQTTAADETAAEHAAAASAALHTTSGLGSDDGHLL